MGKIKKHGHPKVSVVGNENIVIVAGGDLHLNPSAEALVIALKALIEKKELKSLLETLSAQLDELKKMICSVLAYNIEVANDGLTTKKAA